MLRRIGIFFMMVGGAMALIYWVSTYFPTPDFLFLMIGLLIFVGGFFLLRTHPPPPPPERPRFRLLRKKKKAQGENKE
jgi:hypothetical protein